jgi:hypothetical protein
MIRRLMDLYWYHRTARRRDVRHEAAITYWMNECMKLERMYEDATPAFIVVDDEMLDVLANEVAFGEFPPIETLLHSYHEGPGL